MKLKNLLLITALTFTGLAASAQLTDSTGGPDAYGYTWKTNKFLPLGAPVYKWVDISTIGVNGTAGLGDDNALPSFIPLGFEFHYYYSDYTKVRIGSNGWISFNNVGNIAPAFQTIPTPGSQGDNYIAAYLTDLSFGGTGNPAKLYYYTNTAKDTFIVTYENVPYFKQPSTFSGSNTFQIILSAVDSSITFQYKDMDPAFNGSGPNYVQAGIENVSGGIGIQAFADKAPADLTVLKFTYPKVVTAEIADVGPLWIQNDANGGFFLAKGTEPVTIRTNIGNVGNKNVSSITVAGVSRYSGKNTALGSKIIPSLTANNDTTINLSTSFVPNATGTYRLTVTSTLSGDQNGTNNSKISEMIIVDTAASKIELRYVSGSTPDGFLGLAGADVGGGIYIEPPFYPCVIASISSLLIDSTGNLESTGALKGEYTAKIMDNNGPNGIPGDELFSIKTSEGVYRAFNEILIPNGIVITEGGFYVNIFPGEANRLTSEASSSSLPASLRTFEILGGNAAPYREASSSDFMISATIMKYNVGINSKVNDVLTFNHNYPNPATDYTTIAYSLNKPANVTLKVTNMIGQEIETFQFAEQSSGIHNYKLNTVSYPSGVYFYTLEVNGEQSTGKMIISK